MYEGKFSNILNITEQTIEGKKTMHPVYCN